MTTKTLLLILIAGVIAFTLAIFMYGYKNKTTPKLRWILGVLRFLTLFGVLLLIVNPKFHSVTVYTEKPKLPIVVDNSASIAHFDKTTEVTAWFETLKEHKKLNAKFDVSFYQFGSEFGLLDSLSFDEKNTHIARALNSIFKIYKNQKAPIILATDGNQTYGADYEFVAAKSKMPIYPVVIGDTVRHSDLKIEQVNVNRYAFHKNNFPVETIITFSGDTEVHTEFVIKQGEHIIHREPTTFSKRQNSKTVTVFLSADRVGLQKYSAEILPLSEEKNKDNNQKHFAVEVIDQATQVLIVSDLSHPDLGALKKSITANEQRKVDIKKPQEAHAVLNDYQLIILYQPNNRFRMIFDEIEKLEKNYWLISGLKTDWNSLNRFQDKLIKKATQSKDEVQGELNSNYGSFAVENIGFDDFPPLFTQFGTVETQMDNEEMLSQVVSGIQNENPLLATFESHGRRMAFWDGEGFWRWRAAYYRKEGDFVKYDDFVGNLVQYLASTKQRSRLELTSESFYYNNLPIKISVQYFDKNFEFDPRASLMITVKNQETESSKTYPLLLRNNFFEVDMGDLPAGNYDYTVSVPDENIARSGSFTILEFNVEQQFLNPDSDKLQRIAQTTGGRTFFIDQADLLIDALIDNPEYKNIQKSERKTIPLIDWKYLLGIIVFLVSCEWFIRKYNGLV